MIIFQVEPTTPLHDYPSQNPRVSRPASKPSPRLTPMTHFAAEVTAGIVQSTTDWNVTNIRRRRCQTEFYLRVFVRKTQHMNHPIQRGVMGDVRIRNFKDRLFAWSPSVCLFLQLLITRSCIAETMLDELHWLPIYYRPTQVQSALWDNHILLHLSKRLSTFT